MPSRTARTPSGAPLSTLVLLSALFWASNTLAVDAKTASKAATESLNVGGSTTLQSAAGLEVSTATSVAVPTSTAAVSNPATTTHAISAPPKPDKPHIPQKDDHLAVSTAAPIHHEEKNPEPPLATTDKRKTIVGPDNGSNPTTRDIPTTPKTETTVAPRSVPQPASVPVGQNRTKPPLLENKSESSGGSDSGEMSNEEESSASSSSSADLYTQPCKTDSECSMIPHSMCNISSGQCSCKVGYSPMNKKACGKKLGDPCNDRCDSQNTLCVKHVCSCEDGLTASRDGTFCYGIPLWYRDVCDHNDNCSFLGDNIECKEHTCLCKDNYIRWDSVCKEKVDRLNAECDPETQVCYVDLEGDAEVKRECQNGSCRCRNKFVPHNGICKEKISLLGAPCNTTSHVCHLEADGGNQHLNCIKGICQCKDTYLLDNGKCKKKIDKLGEKCSPEIDICYQPESGYHQKMECVNGTCQCRSSFIKHNQTCKQKISLLGAPCNANSDICYIEEDDDIQRIHCQDGICQCKPDFELKDRRCRSTSGGLYASPSFGMLLILFVMEVLR